jgi:predicted transcriptional regulator
MPSEESMEAAFSEILERIAAAGGGVFIVPESHRAAVLEGLGQAQRGELVDDDDMAKLWKRCGL